MAGAVIANRRGILLETVVGFLDRHGMARSRFGKEAVGNPMLVWELDAGRRLRLDTADRLLAWMGEEPFGPAFRSEVEAFIATTGVSASDLGRQAVGDPSFVGRLRKGSSPRLDTCDRVSAWMAERSGGNAFPLMKIREAAKYAGVSQGALHRMRAAGEGPEYFRAAGTIRYSRAGIEAWTAARGNRPAARGTD